MASEGSFSSKMMLRAGKVTRRAVLASRSACFGRKVPEKAVRLQFHENGPDGLMPATAAGWESSKTGPVIAQSCTGRPISITCMGSTL